MKNDDCCSGCSQKDSCRQAYEKLGRVMGPNVAWPAVVAFLVPIGVFIGGLSASRWVLRDRLEENTLTLVSFLLAVCLTLLVVFAIRAANGSVKKNEHCEKR